MDISRYSGCFPFSRSFSSSISSGNSCWYLCISLSGYGDMENRTYASYKFFLYTQASGLIMFIAILVLYFIHGVNTGIYTFDYNQLLGTSMPLTTSMILMLGFLAAFLVKLPVVPLHNWLPDAHSEAPTAGSVYTCRTFIKDRGLRIDPVCSSSISRGFCHIWANWQ